MFSPSSKHADSFRTNGSSAFSFHVVGDSTEAPHEAWQDDVDPQTESATVTLRDWFAGQALAGVIAKLTHEEYLGCAHVELADDAYRLADAMLQRRRR